jgi:hypothetical protein
MVGWHMLGSHVGPIADQSTFLWSEKTLCVMRAITSRSEHWHFSRVGFEGVGCVCMDASISLDALISQALQSVG